MKKMFVVFFMILVSYNLIAQGGELGWFYTEILRFHKSEIVEQSYDRIVREIEIYAPKNEYFDVVYSFNDIGLCTSMSWIWPKSASKQTVIDALNEQDNLVTLIEDGMWEFKVTASDSNTYNATVTILITLEGRYIHSFKLNEKIDE